MERKPKVIVAIQVRNGLRQRVPNKALVEICGQTAIEHLIERVLRSKETDEVVLATTTHDKDDVLETIVKKWKIKCFRGSEQDVLSRLYGAVKKFDADALLRITGDHTLLDAETIDLLISEYRERAGKIDFLTNCLPLTFPQGYNMEIISGRAFKVLDKELRSPEDREAFVIHLARHPDKFPAYTVKNDRDLSDYRFSLDYPEDLELIKKVYEFFYKNGKEYFRLPEIIEFLDANPELAKINSHRTDRMKYPFSLGDAALRRAL